MSAAVCSSCELTAEVSKSGNCEVYLGDAKNVIKHSWRLHTLGVAFTTPHHVDNNSKSHRAKNRRIRKVHIMELIGEHEIYRSGSKLAGIEGTLETYHFMGANTPKNDAARPTDGLQDVDRAGGAQEGEGGAVVAYREKEWLTEMG